MAKPDPYLTFFLARDLFRKPVPTFRDHALARMTGQWVMRRVASTLSRGLRPDPKTKGSARRRSLYRRTLRPLTSFSFGDAGACAFSAPGSRRERGRGPHRGTECI